MVAAPIEIDVWQGEIAELEVDALIVPANESLFMTAGPAASVKRHGGEIVERAAVDQGPILSGGAVVSPGGVLAASYVIHTVAVGHDLRADPDRLRAALAAAFDFVRPLQLRRVALTLLGTERGAFTPEDSAAIVVPFLVARRAEPDLLESVVIVTGSPAETRAVVAALEHAQAEAG